MADLGSLQIKVFRRNTYVPIPNAKVIVTSSEQPTEQNVLVTNDIGETEVINLPAPPVSLSLDIANTEKPYSDYDITVEADGYENLVVRGCQVFSDVTALQICNLIPLTRETIEPITEVIIVPANTLYGDFPPKIPEDPIKPVPPPTGGVVLPQVVVPEFIVVHAGVPTNAAAPNYTVGFQDYIKNVASCEIYATWPETTIRANIYCILSFTLNRIFTEWYRGKGFKFDITNSTAFDHAFTYGRNIFENISRIVDEIFTTYVKRRGSVQPLLTQYCDGRRVQCPGWLTQWGSKDLGDQGFTPYEILTRFYGQNIDLVQAPKVSGIPKSYPGYTLKIGNRGESVRVVQTFLNRISQNFPLIPKLAVDGNYGPATANSVKVFQRIFNLPQTGEVDYATWYKISGIYVGVSKIAELRNIKAKEEAFGEFIPPMPFSSLDKIPTVKYRK